MYVLSTLIAVAGVLAGVGLGWRIRRLSTTCPHCREANDTAYRVAGAAPSRHRAGVRAPAVTPAPMPNAMPSAGTSRVRMARRLDASTSGTSAQDVRWRQLLN